ncbi:MAG TPA: ABC transporter substrate-binding protein [Stellaceae bacterium]|jgi:ABC-type nitrate/sulfonate/bicarbonate transport system substrate-binding protein|nr:ABC transporter substrate-binding protein [Stellaceae bacterium]
MRRGGGWRTAIALLGMAAMLATGEPAAAESDNTTLSLPGEGVTFLPFYAAQDAHFFEQQGLTVKTVYLPGVGTTNAVISGAVDFGISNGVSLTRAAAHGQNLLAIANMSDRPGWTLIMRKEVVDTSGIDMNAPLAQRMQILKGRTFAIDTVSSLAHAYLRVLEKAGGIDPDAVPITPVQPQDAVAVLERKAIDGYIANAPFSEMGEIMAGGVPVASALKDEPPGLYPIALGMILTRPQFCAARRDTCMRMGHAIAAALKFVHDDRQDAYAILKNHYSKLDDEILRAAFEDLEQLLAQSPVIAEAAIANSDRMNIAAGFMKPEDARSSYKDLFSDEFVR